MDIQVQEAYKSPKRHDQKRSSPWHIIVKLSNVLHKEIIMQKKSIKSHLRVFPITESIDFSTEIG
jgi:hypothetical protein